MKWLLESNRYKHLLYAIPLSFVFTFFCGLGAAIGMELKDKLWGGEWDWLDFLSTIIGSLIGGGLQLLVYYFIV